MDRLTPVPNNCSDWLDSDDGEESDFKETESTDNLDHLTLAERLARKRKTDSSNDIGKLNFHERVVIYVLFLLPSKFVMNITSSCGRFEDFFSVEGVIRGSCLELMINYVY